MEHYGVRVNQMSGFKIIFVLCLLVSPFNLFSRTVESETRAIVRRSARARRTEPEPIVVLVEPQQTTPAAGHVYAGIYSG